MAGDATTIARPYAEAIFARAVETSKLELWAETLEFLSMITADPALAAIISNPLFDRGDLADLMVEIGGGRLSDEGANLVRLLTENGRLTILPEIKQLFEDLKAEKEQVLKVHVISAYALQAAQEKELAASLKNKLGREVTITSEKDPDLIGGVHIRAGDTVIDGTIKGQLQKLANELGI